jgi:hypothetical protein
VASAWTARKQNYRIDRALATGELDSAGNLAFPVKGSREEIIEQITATAKTWGMPMTRDKAEEKADAAFASVEKRRSRKWAIIIAIVVGAAIAARILGL